MMLNVELRGKILQNSDSVQLRGERLRVAAYPQNSTSSIEYSVLKEELSCRTVLQRIPPTGGTMTYDQHNTLYIEAEALSEGEHFYKINFNFISIMKYFQYDLLDFS